MELGWMRTDMLNLVVLQTSSLWFLAQFMKNPLTMHLRMLVFWSSQKMDSQGFVTSIQTRSNSPASCSLTSLARRSDRTCRKLSVHHCELNSKSCQLLQTCRRARWSPPGRKNVFLALSACILRSLGRKKTALPTESMAQMVMAWSMQRQCSERISILASMGSRGNSAILRPNLVNSPRSLSAPRAQSISNPRTSMSWGGGSRKSKSTRFSTPMLFSISTTLVMLLRWIQGMVDSYNYFQQLHNVQSRKHLPAATRPARPAR